jgi:hypothetical protein
MIRPGSNVSSPATQRAGKHRDHDAAMRGDAMAGRPPHTPSGSITSVKIDSKWIGLQGPTNA